MCVGVLGCTCWQPFTKVFLSLLNLPLHSAALLFANWVWQLRNFAASASFELKLICHFHSPIKWEFCVRFCLVFFFGFFSFFAFHLYFLALFFWPIFSTSQPANNELCPLTWSHKKTKANIFCIRIDLIYLQGIRYETRVTGLETGELGEFQEESPCCLHKLRTSIYPPSPPSLFSLSCTLCLMYTKFMQSLGV